MLPVTGPLEVSEVSDQAIVETVSGKFGWTVGALGFDSHADHNPPF